MPAAEPQHIDNAPSIAPDAPPDAANSSEHDYFRVRKRKVARREAERNYGITLPRVAIALACVVISLVFWREKLVRIFPQTASLYASIGMPVNVRGLEFGEVKTGYETHDGVRVMVVEGEIRNVTSGSRPVGKLRYSLRNAGGVEIYTWTGMPDVNQIGANDVQKFRTRLASPPAERHDLSVRFVQARDLVATKQ
jgi:hypothetical protein